MFDRLTAHRPLRNLSRRTHVTIGAAAAIPALLLGVLASTHPGAPRDSGLVACAYPWATQNVPAAEYPKLRAEFAGSRFPDLRTAGTAYVDLAIALHTARGTDGYETVWFNQRLSAACAKHERLTAAPAGSSDHGRGHQRAMSPRRTGRVDETCTPSQTARPRETNETC